LHSLNPLPPLREDLAVSQEAQLRPTPDLMGNPAKRTINGMLPGGRDCEARLGGGAWVIRSGSEYGRGGADWHEGINSPCPERRPKQASCHLLDGEGNECENYFEVLIDLREGNM